MAVASGSLSSPAPDRSSTGPQSPRPLLAVLLGSLSTVAIAVSAWLALKPGAETAQAGLVLWFNDPPQPFAAVFAAVNPLLRPVPLLVVTLALVGWILLTASEAWQRLEILRALVVAIILAELLAQVLKRLADQPRPLAVIPGLNMHGYPTDPHGNAYPSAHTAMAVAAVLALWPWMRWPQRIVGAGFAVLIACNRLYIGAHWPIDVLGGAAIGLLCGSVSWLIATRWPLRRRSHS
ncbi:phosphatase PAP2 family protein [Terrabacter sp. Ter38]|uniref:phosphatase PAP2 family protein n=1 Tax=Terrabacter sp. Ter38 TaxID=2926030 RepID=UPI002118720E|nr:phosphatase PAP2 family protein [Terrabacter sp. Ter38]